MFLENAKLFFLSMVSNKSLYQRKLFVDKNSQYILVYLTPGIDSDIHIWNKCFDFIISNALRRRVWIGFPECFYPLAIDKPGITDIFFKTNGSLPVLVDVQCLSTFVFTLPNLNMFFFVGSLLMNFCFSSKMYRLQ